MENELNDELYGLVEGWGAVETLLRVYISLAIPRPHKHLSLKVMCPQSEPFQLWAPSYTKKGKMPLFLIKGKRSAEEEKINPWENFKSHNGEDSIDRLIDSIHEYWQNEMDFWIGRFHDLFPRSELDPRIEICTLSDDNALSVCFVTVRKFRHKC